MATEFYFFFAFALIALFFVLVVSVGIVLNKFITGGRARLRDQMYEKYSNVIAEVMLVERPEADSGSPRFSKTQRVALDRVRAGWKSMGGRKRGIARRAMKDVLIDFSRDVTGESLDIVAGLFDFFGFVEKDMELLGHRKWWVRAQACRDLGLMLVRKAIKPLAGVLVDESEDVRQEAIRALASIVGVGALRTIFSSVGEMSRWTALELSLVVMKFRESAVPYLIEGLDSQNHTVVLFCIEMLSEIGFVEAVDSLLRVAGSYPNVSVRAKAFEALGRLGDERAEPLLREQVRNPIPELRVAAIRALGAIGSPAAVPWLEERFRVGGIREKLDAARAMSSSGSDGVDKLLELAERDRGVNQAVVLQVLEESGIDPRSGEE